MHRSVDFFTALADATRWRIIRLVENETLCVCEIADILDMPQSSVSSHLQIIRKGGLLLSERCGKWIYYRLDPQFLAWLENIRTQLGDTPEAIKQIKADATKARQRLAMRESSCCPLPKTLSSQMTGKNEPVSR